MRVQRGEPVRRGRRPRRRHGRLGAGGRRSLPTAGRTARPALIRERLGGCTVIGVAGGRGQGRRVGGPGRVLSARPTASTTGRARTCGTSPLGLIYDEQRVELRTECRRARRAAQWTTGSIPAAPGPRSASRIFVRRGQLSPLRPRRRTWRTLLVSNAAGDRRTEVRLVVVHLKSKRGDEEENLERRVAAGAAGGTRSSMTPNAAGSLGDFNDDLGSAPDGASSRGCQPVREVRGARRNDTATSITAGRRPSTTSS